MEKEVIKKRIAALRNRMKEKKIDAIYIPTSDYHGSEYVGEYFRCREFFSGFTGSAGTLIVLQNQAGLWTDGRYFLQAEEELKGTEITLYKMQEQGVLSIKEFLETFLQKGQTLSLDGRTLGSGELQGIARAMEKKGVILKIEEDIAGEVWEQIENRPKLSKEPIWELSIVYSGKSRQEKIKEVREMMKEQKADVLLISSLDHIAWLFNLRGNDIPYVPVFLSYVFIEQTQIKFYVSKEAFSKELTEKLEKEQIVFYPYQQIYGDLLKLEKDWVIWLDQFHTNAALMKNIPVHCKILKKRLPTIMMKAIKNTVEIENEKKAHLYDGIAFCKFLYWLKQELLKGNVLTEISVAEKLESFRKQQKTYIEPSFAPISAYAEHGAIVHYSATRESNAILQKKSFLLMDTGAHYLEGSTDITRTIALGELTQKQKQHYTAVLRGNLNLGAAKFIYGSCGVHLDILARSPLWELGLDFNHGTGHGVGYLLNVHEEPNNICRNIHAKDSSTVLEEGMITSNEPGVYLEKEYGIRLENMILCKKAEKTKQGQFMKFETLTMVPMEREAILPEMLNKQEKTLLNAYHHMVFEKISPYLTKEETLWLQQATKEIV